MIIFNCCLVNSRTELHWCSQKKKKRHIIPKKWHVTWSTDLMDICNFYLNILLIQQIFMEHIAYFLCGGGGTNYIYIYIKRPPCGMRHHVGWYPYTYTQIQWSKWHHIPEDRNILSYQCDNLKPYSYFITLTHHSLRPIKWDKNFTE